MSVTKKRPAPDPIVLVPNEYTVNLQNNYLDKKNMFEAHRMKVLHYGRGISYKDLAQEIFMKGLRGKVLEHRTTLTKRQIDVIWDVLNKADVASVDEARFIQQALEHMKNEAEF